MVAWARVAVREMKSSCILVIFSKLNSRGFPDSWWMGEKEESRMTPRFLAHATGRMELSSVVGGAASVLSH